MQERTFRPDTPRSVAAAEKAGAAMADLAWALATDADRAAALVALAENAEADDPAGYGPALYEAAIEEQAGGPLALGPLGDLPEALYEASDESACAYLAAYYDQVAAQAARWLSGGR